MSNIAKFNASKIKLYGQTQTVEGTPEALIADNAIIAMNLSYDENISSKTDVLAGDALDRNAITSISDRFGEVSFDTYLPYLGNVTGTTELAELTFTASGSNTLFVATENFVITVGANAINAAFLATSTLAQAVDETVAYLNNGTAGTKFTFSTSAGTGRVGIRDVYSVSNGIQSTDGKIVFTAVVPSQNVTSITISGTAGRATLEVTEGISTATSVKTIPLAPFLESSNLAQTITYKYGLKPADRAKYTSASSQLVLGISSGSTTTAQITTAINKLKELTPLFRTGTVGDAGRANTATLITNLGTLKTNVISTIWGTADSLRQTLDEIELLLNNFDNSILQTNYTTAVSTLKTETATARTTILNAQTNKIGDLSGHATWGTTALLTYIDANITITWTTVEKVLKATELKDAARAAIVAAQTAIAAVDTYATLNTGTTSAYKLLDAINTTISPATFTTGKLAITGVRSLKFSNDAVSNTTCTYQIRKMSADLTTTEKTIKLKDVRSTVDLNIVVGERPMIKVNAHGNLDTTADEASFAYDIATQKTLVADVTTSSNLNNVSITPTGTATYNNNVCFQKLSISNFDGFTHTRTMTGCGNFWQPEATVYDFTMTILEDSATANGLDNFNPVDSINKEFDIVLKQGTTAYKRYTVTLTKCVFKSFKHTTVAGMAAQDLTFSMTGKFSLLLD